MHSRHTNRLHVSSVFENERQSSSLSKLNIQNLLQYTEPKGVCLGFFGKNKTQFY